jgi:hypothetical protein
MHVLVTPSPHDQPGEVQPHRSAALRAFAGEAVPEADEIREGGQARHDGIATCFMVFTQSSMRPRFVERQAGARCQPDSDLSGTPGAVG